MVAKSSQLLEMEINFDLIYSFYSKMDVKYLSLGSK